MNRKEKIEKEVQRTLDSFNQAERLGSNPFFYTRLRERLNEAGKNAQKKMMDWQLVWGGLKPALLLLIVAINIYTAVRFLNASNQPTASRDELISAFAQDFHLDSTQNSPNFFNQ